MNILGIETSCDETAAAVVAEGKTILTSTVASSSDFFKKYGGVVPEIAARKQVEYMTPVLSETMQGFSKDDIDAIAVTVGPGLIGSLLVGVETAKTLSMVWNKPIIPVNHVLAHMYANFINSYKQEEIGKKNEKSLVASRLLPIAFPAISLVVSGGHTELYLMKNERELTWIGGTLDDAAGEAFDKTARLLGFENRGGAAIEEAASKFKITNDKLQIHLPRPMLHDHTLNFSFSGLKTAVMREWKKYSTAISEKQEAKSLINAFSWEIQEAITDVLVKKTIAAAEKYNAKSILLSGGVAANSRLREKFHQQLITSRFSLIAPPTKLCPDNAVSIAACAYYLGKPVSWKEVEAKPDLSVEV